MDLVSAGKYFFALLFVAGLILFFAWIVRKFGLEKKWAGAGRHSQRLKVVEVLPIDPRRRLVLVKRDATEHLLLLGQHSETVVERGIGSDTGKAI